MKPIARELAVALATCDRPAALARCLDALLGGRVWPVEVVIVDQSTGDETRRLIENHTSPVPLVYVRQERRGLSASRNAALARTRADALAVTDDDCVPDPDWLATLAAALRANPDLGAVTGRVLPYGPPEPGKYAVSSRTSTAPREFARRVPPWLVGTGANLAVRRAAALAIGGYDERLGAGTPGGAGEDLDFQDRLLTAGTRIRYEPGAVVYHERQDRARRLASRSSYGRGVGACCGLRLRQGDAFALPMLAAWLLLRGRVLLTGLARGRTAAIKEEFLVLRGTVGGLAYGLRAPALHRSSQPRNPSPDAP